MSMYTNKKDAAHEKAADKAAEGPPVQAYPKMLYHENGSTVTVATAEEEAVAAKGGYVETLPPAEKKSEKKDKD